jgi:ligand-binding sensor domain-containing protein
LLAAGLALFGLPVLSTSADRTGPIRQMNHRTWTVANGAPADIWDMKDDANGFIWLATGDGLFRFDGLEFDPYRPLSGQFASKNMTALQIISSDELWVGTADGTISHVDHGRVTNYAISSATNHGLIYRFAVTPDGVLWVVTAQKLLRFSGTAFEPVDAGWSLPMDSRPSWLAVDANGTLWLATDKELLFLRKDQRQFHQTGIPVGVHAVLTVAPSGTLWVSDGRYGTRPLPGLSIDHVPDALKKPTLGGTLVRTQRLAFDDDGAMWGTLSTSGDIRGVIRVKDAALATQPLRQDRVDDLYTPEDGLTSVTATPIFVDREGDVWVGTNFGLNRFHPNTFTLPEPTSASPSAMAWVTPGYDKSVRVLHRQCLYDVTHAVSEQVTCGFLHGTNMLIDTGTRSYSATEDELFEWDRSGAGGPVPFPENALLTSLNAAAVDAGHHLWLGMAEGVFKRDNHQWEKIDLGRSVGVAPPSAMAFDWLDMLWLGYADGRIARKTAAGEDTQVLLTHTVIGAVQAIFPQGDAVYFGGDAGFGRQRYGLFKGVVMSQLGLTGTVTGIAADRAGNLWLNASQGVIRIEADDVDKMFDIPDFRPRFRVYGSDDGVPGIGLVQYVASTITVDEDGRLWFATNQGVSWIDPKSVHVNPVAPQTIIKSIRADGRDYSVADRLMLPPKTAAVTFDFTAASYRSPQNVLFKYRLLGFDPTWQESGTLRSARYTNLPPGTYHFQVIAANSDGIWSEAPAQFAFTVEPTFYQQLRFRVLLAAVLSLTVFALFLFQHRKAMLRLRDRLEARHAERESIARDLHDTLIQFKDCSSAFTLCQNAYRKRAGSAGTSSSRWIARKRCSRKVAHAFRTCASGTANPRISPSL